MEEPPQTEGGIRRNNVRLFKKACIDGNIEEARRLLPELTNEHRERISRSGKLFSEVCSRLLEEIVEFLAESGFRVRNGTHSSPLEGLVENKDRSEESRQKALRIFNILVRRGALFEGRIEEGRLDINQGRRVLHLALYNRNNYALIQALYDNGCRVDRNFAREHIRFRVLTYLHFRALLAERETVSLDLIEHVAANFELIDFADADAGMIPTYFFVFLNDLIIAIARGQIFEVDMLTKHEYSINNEYVKTDLLVALALAIEGDIGFGVAKLLFRKNAGHTCSFDSLENRAIELGDLVFAVQSGLEVDNRNFPDTTDIDQRFNAMVDLLAHQQSPEPTQEVMDLANYIRDHTAGSTVITKVHARAVYHFGRAIVENDNRSVRVFVHTFPTLGELAFGRKNHFMALALSQDSERLQIGLTLYRAGLNPITKHRTLFHECVRAEDAAVLDELLTERPDMIDATNQFSMMTLIGSLINESDEETPGKQTVVAETPEKVDAHLRILEVLVKHRTTFFLSDDFGDSVLALAVESRDVRIVNFLLDNPPTPRNERNRAATPEDLIPYLQRRQMDGWMEHSPLEAAVKRGDIDVLRVILNKHRVLEVSINSEEVAKATVLHTAVKSRVSSEIIWLLRSQGADPNIQNRHGMTPLDLAKNSRLWNLGEERRQQKVIEALQFDQRELSKVSMLQSLALLVVTTHNLPKSGLPVQYFWHTKEFQETKKEAKRKKRRAADAKQQEDDKINRAARQRSANSHSSFPASSSSLSSLSSPSSSSSSSSLTLVSPGDTTYSSSTLSRGSSRRNTTELPKGKGRKRTAELTEPAATERRGNKRPVEPTSESVVSKGDDRDAKRQKEQIRALLVAVKSGNQSLVRSLFRENAALRNVRTGTGKSLTQYAQSNGHRHLVPLL